MLHLDMSFIYWRSHFIYSISHLKNVPLISQDDQERVDEE